MPPHAHDNTISPACRVSFVVTSRNDDFGGDMLKRLRMFSENLLQMANRHRLSGELIIVEWNPPSGPRLHDVLDLTAQSECFAIRFIEVPPEVHHRLRNADVLPLFQMIAKNVGIRRAHGEFICATNQDILFSNELMAFLSQGPLRRDSMYRIDRYDVRAEVPEQAPLDEQLAWCMKNILRIHKRWGIKKKRQWKILEKLRALATLAGWRSLGWNSLAVSSQLLHAVAYLVNPEPKLHTNACGDFTMMTRERWHALRGYAEMALYSLHIDSLLCYSAVTSGLRERVLRPPARIFHLEHGSSWAVMGLEEKMRWFAKKPWIDYGLLYEAWREMYYHSGPLILNGEDWGAGDVELNEVVIENGASRAVVRTEADALSRR